MLNPEWYKFPYKKDLQFWHELEQDFNQFRYQRELPSFFNQHKNSIIRLYTTYYKRPGGVNPNRQINQIFQILKKLMPILEVVADRHSKGTYISTEEDIEKVKKWEEQQKAEESLDARLEREKGEWESRNSSMNKVKKISKRDSIRIAFIGV